MRPTNALLLAAAVLLLHAVPSVALTPLPGYDNVTALTDAYRVHWRVSPATKPKDIFIALEVDCTGWVGFGLAEPTSGSMAGSDMLIGYVDDTTGKVTVDDRYATAFATPTLDTCHDWVVVGGKRVGGTTTIEVRRAISTGDTHQDRAFVTDWNRVVYAYGSKNTFGYHGSTRGASGITFWGAQPIDPSKLAYDTISDYTFPAYTIPTQKTTYACTGFYLEAGDYHVIAAEMIGPKGATAKYLHHAVIHTCSADSSFFNEYLSNPHECTSPVGNPWTKCSTVIYAWAIGMGAFILPDDVGIRLGKSSPGASRLLIEIHYDNRDFDAGKVDTSGIRFYSTKKLRKYDMGVVAIGDPLVLGEPIPPNQTQFEYQYTCDKNCTVKLPNPINIFGSFQHMHEVGAMSWTRHFTNGGTVNAGVTNKIEYYAFDYQQITPVNFVVSPGDRFVTHCVWDTTSRQSWTKFGMESTDEMCMDFLFYWPAIVDADYCGYGDNDHTDVCANGDYPSDFIPIVHIADSSAELNRTFGSADPRKPDQCPIH